MSKGKKVCTLIVLLGASTVGQSSFAQSREDYLPTNLRDVVTFAIPPDKFDPATASDLELLRYGLPPRPDKNEAPMPYAAWLHLVSGPQGRIAHPIITEMEQRSRPNTAVTGALNASAGTGTSGNWSGLVVTSSTNKFAPTTGTASMFTEYTVPVAQQAFGTCSSSKTYSAVWAGFDGYVSGSSDVLQAGVEADATCSSGTTTAYYYPWYEWFPAGQMSVSLAIGAGDTFATTVWYTPGATYTGHAYLRNFTKNASVTLAFNPPAGTSLGGTSAEWITEATSYGGVVQPLTNYTSVPFNLSYAYDGSSYYYPGSSSLPSGGTSYSITMIQSSENVSYPSTTGNTSFWTYNEGPSECASGGCYNPGTNSVETY